MPDVSGDVKTAADDENGTMKEKKQVFVYLLYNILTSLLNFP